MASKFFQQVFQKELLWAGAGGAAAYGAYYGINKFLPELISGSNTVLKQAAVIAGVGLGGAFIAAKAKAPKGFAAGMVGMAGTLGAVLLLTNYVSRGTAGLRQAIGPGDYPASALKPNRSYVAVGALPGTGMTSMAGVSEVKVRDNPNFLPQIGSQMASLRAAW